MTLAGWTRRLPPVPGELLTSCLARNAYAHGSTPYRFFNLFWEHDPIWNRDFDRDPAGLLRTVQGTEATDWLKDLADRIGVPRETIEQATLTGWRERLGDGPRRRAGDTPLLLSAGVFHRDRIRHALMFCPDCLTEDVPHFRKAWRLGFMVACGVHGRALLDACRRCDAPVVPHRSLTPRLTDCHSCGRAITGGSSASAVHVVREGAVAMQGGLLALLHGEGATPGPWPGRDAFDAVRCLLAVSALPKVHARLRGALGLGEGIVREDSRFRFEHCRLATRAPWLETVHAWMQDWPRCFHAGADAAGLTRRSFVRCRLPPALAQEVARLPVGIRRDHSWKPVLDEPVLRRLRRTDPSEYRRVRAERILLATGFKA